MVVFDGGWNYNEAHILRGFIASWQVENQVGRERSSQTQFLPVPGVWLIHPTLPQ